MKVFIAIATLFALAAARPPVLGPSPVSIIPGGVYEFGSNGALVQLILNINPAAFPAPEVPPGVVDAPINVDPVIVAEPDVPGDVVPEPVVIGTPVIPEPVVVGTPEFPVVVPEPVINLPEPLN